MPTSVSTMAKSKGTLPYATVPVDFRSICAHLLHPLTHRREEAKLASGGQHPREPFIEEVHQLAVIAPHQLSYRLGEERSLLKGLKGGADHQTHWERQVLHHHCCTLGDRRGRGGEGEMRAKT